ncbi:DUF4446 family protein [Candidatus Kaiserbacteria bacterium]|nr:DUF4446 family protein [Candidatus Kaiserbacteria bacterium]
MQGFEVVFHTMLAQLAGNPVLSGLAILILLAFIQNFLLLRRLRKLVRGGDGKSLEGTINKLGERMGALEAHAVKAEKAFDNLDTRLSTSVRGVSVKRFDPFKNAGGQQSFATALLNEKGHGVVLSGIHSRDGVRVYAKDVANFKSERELSEEERDAIEDAKKKLNA